MKIIAILLVLTGIGNFAMYGEIGISASFSGWAALLTGIGFWLVQRAINNKA